MASFIHALMNSAKGRVSSWYLSPCDVCEIRRSDFGHQKSLNKRFWMNVSGFVLYRSCIPWNKYRKYSLIKKREEFSIKKGLFLLNTMKRSVQEVFICANTVLLLDKVSVKVNLLRCITVPLGRRKRGHRISLKASPGRGLRAVSHCTFCVPREGCTS